MARMPPPACANSHAPFSHLAAAGLLHLAQGRVDGIEVPMRAALHGNAHNYRARGPEARVREARPSMPERVNGGLGKHNRKLKVYKQI